VELRLADAQRPVPEIDIGEREPGELAAAHPGDVEQNERDAVRGLVQRMLNVLRQVSTVSSIRAISPGPRITGRRGFVPIVSRIGLQQSGR